MGRNNMKTERKNDIRICLNIFLHIAEKCESKAKATTVILLSSSILANPDIK